MGLGPAAGNGVTERVNPLDDLVISHVSTTLRCLARSSNWVCPPGSRVGPAGKPVGGPARRRYRGPVANEDTPDGLSRLAFHGPMSEARAAQLTARLARTSPGTILDIGCGWGS